MRKETFVIAVAGPGRPGVHLHCNAVWVEKTAGGSLSATEPPPSQWYSLGIKLSVLKTKTTRNGIIIICRTSAVTILVLSHAPIDVYVVFSDQLKKRDLKAASAVKHGKKEIGQPLRPGSWNRSLSLREA